MLLPPVLDVSSLCVVIYRPVGRAALSYNANDTRTVPILSAAAVPATATSLTRGASSVSAAA